MGLEHLLNRPKAAKAAMNPIYGEVATFEESWQPSTQSR